MNLPWLKSIESSWRLSQSQSRIPHAVLLHGIAGSGKRCVAAWMVQTHLGMTGADQDAEFPFVQPEHADLHWISPPEDKHTIGVDQIRGLVGEMSLTSYEGRGKVAVVEPANKMTVNASNSLLKTLEEPSGDALLILIADRLGGLPATIFSRCQRIGIDLPGEDVGVQWLDQIRPHGRWAKLLREAGNAPLAALEAADSEDERELLARDFAAVAARQASPLEVADRWAKLDPPMVFHWLAREVQNCVKRSFPGDSGTAACSVSQSVLQRMDRRKLFCYLDTINGLRSQPAGSFNVLLTLESLLIDWSEDLQNHQELSRLDNLGTLAGLGT